jgi:hypothetical protein
MCNPNEENRVLRIVLDFTWLSIMLENAADWLITPTLFK